MDSTFPFLLSILFSIPRFHIVFRDSIPRFHTVFEERGLEPKLLFNSSPSSKIPALFHFPFGCAYFPAAIHALSFAYESFCLRLFSASLCLFIWTSQKTGSTTGAKKRGCRNAPTGKGTFWQIGLPPESEVHQRRWNDGLRIADQQKNFLRKRCLLESKQRHPQLFV